MTRIDTVTFEFIDLLPSTLIDGVVYISVEHCTIVHKCCDGCGERVVLALSPAQWSLTFDGETITLDYSIGNGVLPCNSHYWIRKNQVIWAKPLTNSQTRQSQVSDREDVVAHHERPGVPPWRMVKRWEQRRGR